MKTLKLKLLEGGGIVTSLLPLLVVIIINWNEYVVAAGGSSWKLTIGGVMAVGMIAATMIGKMKLPGLKTFFAILLVIIFLLEPILADLKLLCAAALGGQLINGFTFEIFAKKYKETMTMEKQADINAKATQKVLEDAINKMTGRV
jgi:hypothetical protein